jgi:epoxyqueuosine reductase
MATAANVAHTGPRTPDTPVPAVLAGAVLKAEARVRGFDLCGIAPAEPLAEAPLFSEWLARGYAGSMQYLARTALERCDVRASAPWARSVVVTATLYNTDRPYSIECADPTRAHVSRYAWGDDYHTILRTRLDAFAEWMRHEAAAAGVSMESRTSVDTGPVHERAYASLAGLGWIGKNTLLINATLGSWLFLGAIITSLPLEPDEPAADQCGTCTLCLEACPTQAFVAPAVLDATRCVSYLTIEHRGPVPDALQRGVGAHVYGCDVCQEVCPWNAHPPISSDPSWHPRAAWDAPSITQLEQLTDEALGAALRGSPMKRAKVSGLRRNIDVVRRNASSSERSSAGGRS